MDRKDAVKTIMRLAGESEYPLSFGDNWCRWYVDYNSKNATITMTYGKRNKYRRNSKGKVSYVVTFDSKKIIELVDKKHPADVARRVSVEKVAKKFCNLCTGRSLAL